MTEAISRTLAATAVSRALADALGAALAALGYYGDHEALRRGLRNEDERDAYWRAITHIAGAQGVALPWPGDAEL